MLYPAELLVLNTIIYIIGLSDPFVKYILYFFQKLFEIIDSFSKKQKDMSHYLRDISFLAILNSLVYRALLS